MSSSSYVDILIAAPNSVSCLTATQDTLLLLQQSGFKGSRKKLQCCRREVTFLGRVLPAEGLTISTAHKTAILNHPKPLTVKDMLSFLGLIGYSRNFIPLYAERTAPLRSLIRPHEMRSAKAALDWTVDAEDAFITLKQLLQSAIDLAVPDHSQIFYLDVSVVPDAMYGVLFQKQKGEGGRKILTHSSIPFEPIEKKPPQCTRYAAGLAAT